MSGGSAKRPADGHVASAGDDIQPAGPRDLDGCARYLPVLSLDDWSIDHTLALIAARQEYGQRRERDRIFGGGLFADPIWDLLLDLFVMASDGQAISMNSACVAANVPSATALRSIDFMEEIGLVKRLSHPTDRRCTYLELTASAHRKMLEYFRATQRAVFEHHG